MNEEVRNNIAKVWLPIVEYEENYIISNYGEIQNINTKHFMKFHNRNGYLAVCLCKNNKKHTINVHRLVASHFLQPATNIEANQVNHMNGNKFDNFIGNLEYVTPKQNTAHARQTNLTPIHCKKVGQFQLETMQLIRSYNSIKEACEFLQVHDTEIPSVCRKRKHSAHGFVWKYLNENNEIIDFQPVVFEETDGFIIEGYPNYKITSDGRILSKQRQDYLVPKRLQSGYQTVKLCNNGKMKDFYIHVLFNQYYPNENSQVHLNAGNNIQS